MHHKYPENTDQLDNFYQKELAEVEVLPPADMWDRIRASYDTQQDKKGFVISFNTTQKRIIGIILLALLFSISTYIYLKSHSNPQEKRNTPVIPQTNINTNFAPIEQPENNTTSGNPNSEKENSHTIRKEKIRVEQNNTNINTTTPLEKNTTEQTQELKTESLNNSSSDIVVEEAEPTVEKAPKKKVSFKDKYKKDYQDSTRNLFVPNK